MEASSPKGRDLRRDARYALHCAVEDNSGGEGEFHLSGRARPIEDEPTRQIALAAARAAGYSGNPRYVVYEFDLERAAATRYEGDNTLREKWVAGQPT
jgi:hypothetical protein